MDCKHENITMMIDTGVVQCHNEDCKKTFAHEDIEIILKSDLQLMQDVIEAGREFLSGAHHNDGCRAALASQCRCGRWKLSKALYVLDALEGEK